MQVGAGLATRRTGGGRCSGVSSVYGSVVVVAVGLVARGDDDRAARARRGAGRPRAGCRCRGCWPRRCDRVAVRDADDRLGAEVEDGVDLVLADGALERAVVLERRRRRPRTRSTSPLRTQLASADRGRGRGDDVGAGVEQAPDQPGADHAGGAGDEDAARRPRASPALIVPDLPGRLAALPQLVRAG